MEGFGPKIMFEIPIFGGIPITETIINMWIVMALLVGFAIFATKRLDKLPKGIQNYVEVIVDAMNKLTIQTMGEDKKSFAPYMGSLFLFLLLANLWGLIGLRPPTADLNTTLALAMMTFFMIHFFGAKSKGVLGYAKGFFEPFILMFPLNVMGELSTPISLGFRLFGNMVGGLIIMSLLYAGLGGVSAAIGLEFFPVLQAGIPFVFHMYFDLFAGVLQTFIFVMLTMVFVSIAMD
ncbi:MAG: ATP synthase F0 subunit A [Alkaliphilus sp.]|jgi:F-type H+-transporting ATPase subunit a|nr:F0F1 ATP synthase subunit A [bacterium AH-315-L21]MBN4062585.1 F0F1 ATP synthase subunit A [Alkaliphilus sp. AH-315-G20]MBN4074589.1 F0F1 ATP synthase subunit A [bacterium AH-315-E09]PHS35363.1 MAG: ATP synthase F0 subunit A [Alkaliphilus sp.]